MNFLGWLDNLQVFQAIYGLKIVVNEREMKCLTANKNRQTKTNQKTEKCTSIAVKSYCLFAIKYIKISVQRCLNTAKRLMSYGQKTSVCVAINPKKVDEIFYFIIRGGFKSTYI